MKKQKKGFTLIELLAIIVILAIIAVITVPIILNIIEESSKGAAKDSAYGFKDAVNKYYTQQLLNNQNLELNDTYTVTNGTLSGGDFGDEEITSLPIAVSGTVPTSGTLVYENNDLKSGCLVIGEYAVTFNEGGTVSTEKGKCIPTMDEMCPGCKFIYTTNPNYYAIEGSSGGSSYNMPTEQDGLTDDYTTLIGTDGHPYFLGLIESTTTPGKIGRAFACGVENGKPFCLEGYDTSKWSADANVKVLNAIYPNCNASASDYNANCSGTSVDASAGEYGGAFVDNGNYVRCAVTNFGRAYCYEY